MMQHIRTLARDGSRSEESGRMVLALMLLRGFWTRRHMEIGLTGFHLAMAYVQTELQRLGIDNAGFRFDMQSKRSSELGIILSSFDHAGIITIEWNGTEDAIAFDADTGKRLLHLLRELDLEAEENRTLMPIMDRAVSFYIGNCLKQSGCDH